MSVDNLTELYIEQLRDLYSANVQARDATRKLAAAATDGELKDALQAGVTGIEDGARTLEEIVRRHGEDPAGEHCRGMEGLVAEADAHALRETFGDPDVKDAMIISQYQRMTHYGIAGYGTVLAFAARLGLEDDARKLKSCLENTRRGDTHMTAIAERRANPNAMH